jgi:hypothetical protein
MVAAPPAGVLAVIADFGAYPQWASGVRDAEVIERAADGRAARVRFKLDAGVVKDSYVLGYDWDGEAGVRWHLAEPGSVISAMTGGYRLTGRDGETEVTYDLTVDVRIRLPGMLKRRAEKVIIDTALKGLKNRVESLSRDPRSGRERATAPGWQGGGGVNSGVIGDDDNAASRDAGAREPGGGRGTGSGSRAGSRDGGGRT